MSSTNSTSAPTNSRAARHAQLIISGGVGGLCGTYLVISGARLEASSVMLVVAAVSVALVAWTVLRSMLALVRTQGAEEVQLASGRRRKELEREKQGLLKALKELEFDHEMGKISDPDHQAIAAGYRARALRVMRQLDEGGSDYRKLIEADLAARRPAAAGGIAKTAPSAGGAR